MAEQIVVSGLLQGCIYALISLGLTLMFGVLKVINFAHGEFLMLAMYGTYFLFVGMGLDPLLGLLIIVPLFVGFGAILYRGLIRLTFTAPNPSMAQIFVTVGLGMFLANAALLVFGLDYLSGAPKWAADSLSVGSLRLEWTKVVAAVAVIVLGFGFNWFLYSAKLGKQMRAVSENTMAAKLMGIDVERVFGVTFAIACGVVGLAGTLLSTTYLIYPTVGGTFVLLSYMTVVIGGLGSIPGAILGGLLIGIVESVTGFALGPILSQVFIYGIFLIVLIFRPSGLLGLRGYEEIREA